jgi:hypothetical protein
MPRSPLARAITLASLGSCLALPNLAHADFVKDSKASLELRNFYMNRDFRQGHDDKLPTVTGKSPKEFKSYSEEWAQGFLFRAESGYTEGTVGVGVDTLGLLGVRLDSGRGRSGTSLLQLDKETGEAQSDYGSLGATGKVKISKSVLKVGTLQPKNPVVQASDSRLLPQTFQGGSLNVLEVDNLSLNAGALSKVKQRNSSDHEDMTLSGSSSRGSDRFNFGGADYALNKNLTLSYYYAELENIYQQNFAGLVYLQPLSEGQTLKADLRYFDSSDNGNQYAGRIDNRALNGMLTYGVGAHSFGLGYQQMNGDNAFPFITDSDPYLVNYVQIGNFAAAEERSWQARYDLNFASYGIPGLSLMSRYVSGDNIDRGAQSNGKEWERDTDIAYVQPDGTFKGVGIKWRNATYRSNLVKTTEDLDENRLILSYTVALW